MTSSKQANRKIWRGIPVAFKVLALCVIALVALLLMLPAPPERSAGGVTTVGKHIPPLRDTVDPLTRAETPVVTMPAPAAPTRQQPLNPVVQEPLRQAPPEPKVATAPEQPAIPPAPAPPDPARKPENEALPPAAGTQDSQPLPWGTNTDVARLPDAPSDQPETPRGGNLPSKSDIRDWLKSQAWEFLGGVDAEGNILYRFEVWLEAPPEALSGIKSVTYDYDAPSATPRTREADEPKSGFRARFGSLACAKEITVTVSMADGRKVETTADGCRALN